MSSNAWPATLPFDPDDGTLPPALEVLFDRPAATIPAILVIAGESARQNGWADRAAIALAAGWAERRSNSVVLADLIEGSELVDLVGDQNVEGIADVLEFGLSLRRVIRPAKDHPFRIIPAGPYLPVATGLFEHPRWGRLIAQFAEEHDTLIAYTAMNSAGLDTLARRIGKAIILAGPEEAGQIAATLPANCTITFALQQPEDFADALTAAADEEGAEAPDLVTDDHDDDAAADQGTPPAQRPESDAETTIETDSDELDEPTFVHRRTPTRRVSPALWVILVIVIVASGWLATQYIFKAPGEPDVSAATAGASADGQPVETPAPFSIALEAHPDVSTASERVRSLSGTDSGTGFFITPIAIDDAIYYRVMAGPTADSVSAVALMHRLVQRGHKSEADAWAVRPTTWAYHLGDYDTASDAAEQIASLAEHGIPAYSLEIPLTVGPARHRVYAGAFEAMAQAEIMGELLERAGLEAPLVRRTGQTAE